MLTEAERNEFYDDLIADYQRVDNLWNKDFYKEALVEVEAEFGPMPLSRGQQQLLSIGKFLYKLILFICFIGCCSIFLVPFTLIGSLFAYSYGYYDVYMKYWLISVAFGIVSIAVGYFLLSIEGDIIYND